MNKKNFVRFGTILLCLIVSLTVWNWSKTKAAAAAGKRVIHILAVEYKGTFPDGHPKAGQKVEAYRWDPGTIVARQGEELELHFYGINGNSHDFTIEGYAINGKVMRGEETIVTLKADKSGLFHLVCATHPPRMTADLIVLPK